MDPGDGVFLPLHREDANGDRRQLSGGGWGYRKGLPIMGATGKDNQEGRGGCTDLGEIYVVVVQVTLLFGL